MALFARWFPKGAPAGADPAPAQKVAPTTRPGLDGTVATLTPQELEIASFCWWMGTTVRKDTPFGREDERLVQAIDAQLPRLAGDTDLLPRTSTIVSELLACLHEDERTLQQLASRVQRDQDLVVEVMRLAGGAAYRSAGPVRDMDDAIARLGTDGLRRAIARVMLRPLFESRPDTLFGRAAERLWIASETKADACAQLAPQRGVDAFEAFLAGLLHNLGWTAVLRLIDRMTSPNLPIFGVEFLQELAVRRDLCFAQLLRAWKLTPGLEELARDLLRTRSLANARTPLGRVLFEADVATARERVAESRAAKGATPQQ